MHADGGEERKVMRLGWRIPPRVPHVVERLLVEGAGGGPEDPRRLIGQPLRVSHVLLMVLDLCMEPQEAVCSRSWDASWELDQRLGRATETSSEDLPVPGREGTQVAAEEGVRERDGAQLCPRSVEDAEDEVDLTVVGQVRQVLSADPHSCGVARRARLCHVHERGWAAEVGVVALDPDVCGFGEGVPLHSLPPHPPVKELLHCLVVRQGQVTVLQVPLHNQGQNSIACRRPLDPRGKLEAHIELLVLFDGRVCLAVERFVGGKLG
eukprot:767306-Hanusia_phi.AAC.5